MMAAVHKRLQAITERITAQSRDGRKKYMMQIERIRQAGIAERKRSSGHLAHCFTAHPRDAKEHFLAGDSRNLAIASVGKKILSADDTCHAYPEKIRNAAHALGADTQCFEGVSTLHPSVTQGRDGATPFHHMFDGIMYFGVCDNIVPSLLVDALSFGHLPTIFVPVNSLETCFSDGEEDNNRQGYCEEKVDRVRLLKSESNFFHGGDRGASNVAANRHQLLMEVMGLQLPGSSLVNPGLPLRDALTRAAVKKLHDCTRPDQLTPLANVISVKTVVNGMVGFLAAGGSIHHSLHLVAMAKAAGITIDSQDFSDLSSIVPLLCRSHSTSRVDNNRVHVAGGVPFLVQELLTQGLLHEDVRTVFGEGLQAYSQEPLLVDGVLRWRPCLAEGVDKNILRPSDDDLNTADGMRLLKGGTVLSVPSVKSDQPKGAAPAIAFNDQGGLGRRSVSLANR